MPDKEWTVPFGNFALLIRRETRDGVMVDFAVVLVVFIGENWVDVTRYETAHGYAHRDVQGQNEGLRGKLRLPKVTYEEAFDYAIRDLKQNATIYLADFLAH